MLSPRFSDIKRTTTQICLRKWSLRTCAEPTTRYLWHNGRFVDSALFKIMLILLWNSAIELMLQKKISWKQTTIGFSSMTVNRYFEDSSHFEIEICYLINMATCKNVNVTLGTMRDISRIFCSSLKQADCSSFCQYWAR